MLPATEQQEAWERACQELVRSLGIHTVTNTLEEAQRLAQALERHGEPVHLYAQRIDHRFGAWSNDKKNGTRWTTLSKERDTVVGVRLGERLVFPCGAGSLDTLLAHEHDRLAARKSEFAWLELNSELVEPSVPLNTAPLTPQALSRSQALAVANWLEQAPPALSNLEKDFQAVAQRCLSAVHLQQVVHYACHLLDERGSHCGGLKTEEAAIRQAGERRWRHEQRYEVRFFAQDGREAVTETLPGVGTLFGWHYRTGDRHSREAQTSVSSSWFPLSPPQPTNVLDQAQTLAAALKRHRLEQRMEPTAANGPKPRF